MKQNGLFNEAARIFNCDKSRFSLDYKPGKVVSAKSLRALNVATSGDKSQLTVLACASASGYAMPPLIIFDRKRLKPDHTQGELLGTAYEHSMLKGWIDSEILRSGLKIIS